MTDNREPEIVEMLALADVFCWDMPRTQQVGPCTRLTFTVPSTGIEQGGGTCEVVMKLVIPTENLHEIGMKLVALVGGRKVTGPLAKFETQGLIAS